MKKSIGFVVGGLLLWYLIKGKKTNANNSKPFTTPPNKTITVTPQQIARSQKRIQQKRKVVPVYKDILSPTLQKKFPNVAKTLPTRPPKGEHTHHGTSYGYAPSTSRHITAPINTSKGRSQLASPKLKAKFPSLFHTL